MDTAQWPDLSSDLLLSYASASISNSEELLSEASLLCNHGHLARAYFLSISSIEETGKALLSFDAQLRNLADPAVCARLKAAFGNHETKITYALSMWAFSSFDPYEALEKACNLMLDLKDGREPSMYSDLRRTPDRAQTPREIIRAKAATDCIRLAEGCLSNAYRHLLENSPRKPAQDQERVFTMKSKKFQEMLKIPDFWWYLIEHNEAGLKDFSEIVTGYERNHIQTEKPFRL